MSTSEQWAQHLSYHQLDDLEAMARQHFYRIIAAGLLTFDLEFYGYLTEYRDQGIKTFPNTDEGKDEARGFLRTVIVPRSGGTP